MKLIVVLALLATSVCSSSLQADTFVNGENQFDVEFVTVGDPGNPHDTSHFTSGTHGGVPYSYRIGKFEVTNQQYVQFLNSVDPSGLNELRLFDSRMSSELVGGIVLDDSRPLKEKFSEKLGRAKQPVVYVTWFDALRFTNWLNNGQGQGDGHRDGHQVGHHRGYGRNQRGNPGDHGGPADGRLRSADHRAVPAALQQPPSNRPFLPSGRICRVEESRGSHGIQARRLRPPGAQLLPRRPAARRGLR
ncbi:MAG: SUMF1/EgtB/PvdO family nonheme iron enzyme [Planctomycetes bacterium]|nr:SUMF1/EgtB/PvdO family nonheme iron enzyme [Planctomycetota bacterium]